MNDLLSRLLKVGSIKHAAILADSKFFSEKEFAPTEVPILNAAFSGSINGGLSSGLTFIAGESKSFKTLLGLVCMKAYMDKHPDSVVLFFDNEYGSTPPYFSQFGIDTTRIIHIPIEHVEQLKFDIVKRLDEIKRGDKVFIFIDSIGNIASKKEVEDAMNENTAADMSRAKSLKSLFRIITPTLTVKDIPCVAINHVYKTQEFISKTIMSGGTGGAYSSNTIFIITKAQEKENNELVGYRFTINIEKSRFVKEKSKFPFTVTYKKGINKWSGLLDLAITGGFVIKPKKGYYQKIDPETGELIGTEMKENKTHSAEFWKDILSNPKFDEFIMKTYKLGDTLDDNYEDDDLEELE